MTPEVSALLTTHNRAHLLPRVLDGLQKQSLPSAHHEIIVIDDGSADETQQVLAAYAGRMSMRVFRQEPSGLAAAKNLGLLVSRAPIVVFLDDDDILHPDALAAHLRAHHSHPNIGDVILGHTSLDAEAAKSPLMRYVTEDGGQLFSYRLLAPNQVYGYREFWGGRSSCKRELLLKHGIFNPVFRFGFEDIECAWRLRHHQLRVFYAPEAASVMIRTIDFDGFCKRSYLQGRAAYRFSQLHRDGEIRAYCEIDNALSLWRAKWLQYQSVMRYARTLDKSAAEGAGNQGELETAYELAFALSRAKGIADACWLDETQEGSGRTAYGLSDDLDSLFRKIATPDGVKRYA